MMEQTNWNSTESRYE